MPGFAKTPIDERIRSRIRKQRGGCWIWIGARTKAGYGRIGYRGSSVYVHRLVIELSGERLRNSDVVMHTCDNPACVRPSHLTVGTQADNMADAIAKGRMPRGEDRGHVKLTERAVRSIHVEYERGGVSMNDLARKHGVNHVTIRAVLLGETWSHLGLKPKASRGRGLPGDRNPSRRHPERCVRGERHPRCKVNDAQIVLIRKALETQSQRSVALAFGLSPTQVGRIARGESRKESAS